MEKSFQLSFEHGKELIKFWESRSKVNYDTGQSSKVAGRNHRRQFSNPERCAILL